MGKIEDFHDFIEATARLGLHPKGRCIAYSIVGAMWMQRLIKYLRMHDLCTLVSANAIPAPTLSGSGIVWFMQTGRSMISNPFAERSMANPCGCIPPFIPMVFTTPITGTSL